MEFRLHLIQGILVLGSLVLVSRGRAAPATLPGQSADAGNTVKPRLLVLTDIGGDPDDQQSMVRLLSWANEFEIKGLIASASGTPGELKEATTKPQLIRQIVEAYGQVRDNLALHVPGYPSTEQLLGCIKSGNPQRGIAAIGEKNDSEGSNWIIKIADRTDARPLNIAIWGGQTDLAQALWRVRHDRSEASLNQFMSHLRVYDIDDQDSLQPWIFQNFPNLFYVLGKAPAKEDKRLGVYRGMYLGGDELLTSRQWIDEHVRVGHGPLGALYPPKTYTAPNRHATLKEGDTPSWFFFLINGLNDAAHPDWGGWGGRFQPAQAGLWRDAKDTIGDIKEARAGVWRWRPAFQAEFQARIDWCSKPYTQANHKPLAVLNGDRSRNSVRVQATPGQRLLLSAAGSTDPDGQRLSCRWWVYREAGTFAGVVDLANAATEQASIAVPADASGKTIHVIMEITDDGIPALTSYRRAVIEIQ